jgi:hypothetical protein
VSVELYPFAVSLLFMCVQLTATKMTSVLSERTDHVDCDKHTVVTELAPRSKFFNEKLRVTWLVKNFAAVCGKWRFGGTLY